MKIPVCKTVPEYIGYLNSKILVCKTAWEAYGFATAEAYAWAYHRQETVLKEVSDAIEKRRKAEEAMATFALNLITVGVGGAMAGACVKRVMKGAAKEVVDEALKKAKEEAVEKIVDKVKEKVSEPIKKGTESLYKHLGTQTTEEAFKPPGTPPDAFGFKLLAGIESRTLALAKMVTALQEQSGSVTLSGVQALTEQVCNSAFVEQTPPEVDADELKPKASVALWLGWAWGRDMEYWRRVNAVDFKYENFDFAPVYNELIKLGVPPPLISQKRMSEPTFFHGAQPQTVIDMVGFINWSNSSDVSRLLFAGIPISNDWLKQVRQQLQIRQMLPPQFRRYYVAPLQGEG